MIYFKKFNLLKIWMVNNPFHNKIIRLIFAYIKNEVSVSFIFRMLSREIIERETIIIEQTMG